MSILLLIALFLSLTALGCTIRTKFGKAPKGERLERIQRSPHYKDGAFRNLEKTPHTNLGDSMFSTMYKVLLGKSPMAKPKQKLCVLRTDLKQLPTQEDFLLWFGHSSYFIQLRGVKFLVDPVFGKHASPIPFSVSAFDGTSVYRPEDMPEVDYLLITHDHYDHLDAYTVKKLKKKVGKVVCGLGVGSHLEYWGYPKERIVELDWGDFYACCPDFRVHVLPARHFSGRSTQKNNTLWVSFLLESPDMKIYLGGDSGYDAHFAEVGRTYGPIDLAILENGQYNSAWPAIHCRPEETLRAAGDLQTKFLMPVHSGKFCISTHAWNAPLKELCKVNEQYRIDLVTPQMGELIDLRHLNRNYEPWWENVE